MVPSLTFVAHTVPAFHPRTTASHGATCQRRVFMCDVTPPSSSSAGSPGYTPGPNSNSNSTGDQKQKDYEHAEMLDDIEASTSMNVWNDVIHASLKRKLQGLVAESPVTNGVSALLHTSPAVSSVSLSRSSSARALADSDTKLTPGQVVSHLLSSFKEDALAGASAFVAVASPNCHVSHTNPETLVLFIGDNDSYRPLLRLNSFYIDSPRFEASGAKCVISVEIHLPTVGSEESAKFDFQLSRDSSGTWLIDEVFRI